MLKNILFLDARLAVPLAHSPVIFSRGVCFFCDLGISNVSNSAAKNSEKLGVFCGLVGVHFQCCLTNPSTQRGWVLRDSKLREAAPGAPVPADGQAGWRGQITQFFTPKEALPRSREALPAAEQ